jgi:hypothetical protein
MKGDTEFAGGTFRSEVAGELEEGSGAGCDGGEGGESAEGEEAGGVVEAEAGPELTGGGAEDAAARGGVKGAKAFELDGDGGLGVPGSGADGAAAAADGFAGEEELGEDAGELGLPAGLFFAGEFGEVGQGVIERGIFLAQEG